VSELPDTPVERLRELVETVVSAIDVEGTVDVRDDGETITATVSGDELGLFIGRHGQTIDAVQHIATRVAGGSGEERRRVAVDASGYRERRARAICEEADRAADDALQFGRPVSLDAMSAIERRVAHEHLRDRGGVETYSEGDEPDRHLVVAPAAD
jgi:spoIIIJ-associated protein